MIRPARIGDAEDFSRIQIAGWRETYRGMVPQAFLDAMEVAPRAARWRTILREQTAADCAFVAEEGGAVVGWVTGGPERSHDPEFMGELYGLYVLGSHHRRGIGRALAAAVAEHLARHGMGSMLLWVLRDNPARRFYERLGGEYLREQPIAIAGATLIEVGYGWIDTSSLVAQARAQASA